MLRLVLVGASVGWGMWAGPGAEALGLQTAHLGRDLITGLIVGLALAWVVNAAGRAAVRHWGPQVFSSRMIRYMVPANGREWVGVLLALLPAAALEELLFRSLPLGGLGWLLSPWWMLWPLALVFGLLHWPQGGWGVVGTVFAGVVLSLLFLATHSIWAPIAAHYLMNVHQLLSARAAGAMTSRNTASAETR